MGPKSVRLTKQNLVTGNVSSGAASCRSAAFAAIMCMAIMLGAVACSSGGAPADSGSSEMGSTSTTVPGAETATSALCGAVEAATVGWSPAFGDLKPISENPIGMSSLWDAPLAASVDTCAGNLYNRKNTLLIAVFQLESSDAAEKMTQDIIAEAREFAYQGTEYTPITGGEIESFPSTERSGATAWASTGKYVVTFTIFNMKDANRVIGLLGETLP